MIIGTVKRKSLMGLKMDHVYIFRHSGLQFSSRQQKTNLNQYALHILSCISSYMNLAGTQLSCVSYRCGDILVWMNHLLRTTLNFYVLREYILLGRNSHTKLSIKFAYELVHPHGIVKLIMSLGEHFHEMWKLLIIQSHFAYSHCRGI